MVFVSNFLKGAMRVNCILLCRNLVVMLVNLSRKVVRTISYIFNKCWCWIILSQSSSSHFTVKTILKIRARIKFQGKPYEIIQPKKSIFKEPMNYLKIFFLNVIKIQIFKKNFGGLTVWLIFLQHLTTMFNVIRGLSKIVSSNSPLTSMAMSSAW